ncbi:MAG: hypothetical protein VX454_07615 [Pseudomonadota bacterium]|nr:hypothetical protein [Pseudomonadota bacterium]
MKFLYSVNEMAASLPFLTCRRKAGYILLRGLRFGDTGQHCDGQEGDGAGHASPQGHITYNYDALERIIC